MCAWGLSFTMVNKRTYTGSGGVIPVAEAAEMCSCLVQIPLLYIKKAELNRDRYKEVQSLAHNHRPQSTGPASGHTNVANVYPAVAQYNSDPVTAQVNDPTAT